MVYNINWDSTTNKDYLKDLLKEVFDSTDREALVEHPQVMRTMESADEYERFARHAGLGLASRIADGAEIPLDDPVLDTTKDATQLRYGLGFRITAGMKKFNKWYKIEDLTKNLGMVMKESKDIEVAKPFNNFTSTTYAGFDGKAIADDAHTALDDAGSTYDNYGNAALGVSSLETALVYFDTLIDDQGQTMVIAPNKLVVHSQGRFTAGQLLGSEKEPFSGDHTKNMFPEWNLSSFVYHRLTSTTNWFLAATKNRNYSPIVITSEAPDIKVQDAPDLSRDIAVTSQQWFAYRTLDPRYIYVGDT